MVGLGLGGLSAYVYHQASVAVVVLVLQTVGQDLNLKVALGDLFAYPPLLAPRRRTTGRRQVSARSGP